MSKRCFTPLCMAACSWLAAGCSDERATPGGSAAVVQPGLRAALASTDEVHVIVSFRESVDLPSPNQREAHQRALAFVRESVLKTAPRGFVPTRTFEHVPAIAGRITLSALEKLARDPNVRFIQFDTPGHGALTVSVPAIGADIAQADYGVTGSGVRVAVLDTGIATSHPDLTSSVVSTQHCFTEGDCPPSHSDESDSAEDDHGHGSHVSGIITSDGSVAGRGFAPDAEIVPVKINDSYSSGWVSDWVAGLDWIYSNLSTLDVRIVNMSICTDQLYSSQNECDTSEPAMAAAVANLVDAGVTIFAASGNKGSNSQMSSPACNTGVIAVGATYKSDQGRQPETGTYAGQWGDTFGDCADETTAFDFVTCFTNSSNRLDILAPGAVIVSDALQGGTDWYRGTSQASPTAAGVAALMLECDPALAPVEIKDILTRTGVMVEDPKNGLSFPSIRVEAAVQEACSGTGGAGGNPETGGTPNTGATSGTGAGAPSGGEATGGGGTTGGVEVTGGSEATGASGAVGGSEATGGNPSTGGSGGSGNVGPGGGGGGTGGSSGAGGTGGVGTTGGNSGVGGGSSTGGATGCAPPLAPCAAGCVDLSSDAHNCGACDVACPAGRVCSSGTCRQAGTGGSGPQSSAEAADDSGCSCRAAETGRPLQGMLSFLLALAAFASRRRRP